MPIQVGDTLPQVTFKTMGAEGPKDVNTNELFDGKTVVLFAVPGAFTPTCHRSHLPGYIARAEDIKSKGVDTIAVVSVNDVFVMDAWSKASGAGENVLFLADGSANFTKAIGLELDGSGFGMGIRSKRYSAVIRDGVVEQLHIEEAPGSIALSGADAMVCSL